MQDKISREQARQLDAADSLGKLRDRFYLPAGQIYLDGNSLGLLSRDLPEALVMRVAKLVGAQADEVTVANSTTVNLHQLLATFLKEIVASGLPDRPATKALVT